ncbi:MAG TPA: D-tyrosyl-tRNA(Tyr) deacylase [Verrucomicrobia bacterium]|nr:D-tyrosyl-tRNA(Tyr) deacylase [Verrucomicrobiales bacterium]HIL55573.1 D-tyrosyl-tRNA(Tyr) deacylase [Verrucomicrobiota bacterium]
MRALIQRVREASVSIGKEPYSKIGTGLLILLGIESADTEEDVLWLTGKVSKIRIFDDGAGQMNLSLSDIGGEMLVVSQFTLHANTKKGNRPSFIRAAKPEHAIPLYKKFISEMETVFGKSVSTGKFGASMQVSLTNNGPVTIWIDSRNRE